MDGHAKVCPKCGLRYDGTAQFCTKDGSTLRLAEEERDPRIGQVLLDQFRIEEAIGAGGMGAVYRARQTTLGRDVAIKILHPDMAQNPEAVRRFHREARISTALDHPNVVRVFLFGQLPDGSLYLVMELLRGRTLAELLRIEPQLPVARALHIATQVAAGVGEAHSQGVVHRDVKPENVFLITKGKDPDFVKVLDFGIARLFRNEDQTQATQSGLVFGTARYISPEGAAGEKTDARSDVYSLGVLTYQLLSGETPFPSAAPVTLLMQHIHDRPPHLKSKPGGAQVPDGIADVVMRALAKNPEGRFEDASDFAEALRDAALRAGIELRPRGQPSGAFSSSSMERERRDPSARVRAEPSQRTSLPAEPSRARKDVPTTEELAAVVGRPRGPRSGGAAGRAFAVAIAFVVGALLVAGGALALEAYSRASAENARLETVTLAERALDEERWEGEASVRLLTDRLLAEGPDDPDARRIRRAAAERLVAQGREALDAGRRDDAQRVVELALVLVPGDADAAALRAELSRPVVPPRVAAVRVTPDPVSGSRVTLHAVIEEGIVVEEGDRPRFVIRRDGVRVGRHVNATEGAEAGTYSADYTFPMAGTFTVEFRVGDGPEGYRVTGEVRVERGARPPGDDEPPITTTGSASPSPFHPVPAVVDVPPPFTSNPATTTTVAAFPSAPPEPPPPAEPEPPGPPVLPPAWTSGN
jgi:serine/threonine-protein kinase